MRRTVEQFEEVLRRCQVVAEPLEAAEARSAKYQWRYRLCAILAATLGTLGLVLSITSLISPAEALRNEAGAVIPSYSRLIVELSLTVASLLVVLIGVFADVKGKWLRERNKAERYKLVQYRFLIDVAGWNALGRLETAVEDIDMETPDLANWVKQEPVPSFEPTPLDDKQLLLLMLQHYVRERLGPQIAFFNARSEAFERRVAWLRPLPVTLFYSSFACAAISAALQAAGSRDAVNLAAKVVALGIVLPVVSGALRTLLLSRELARNSSRYAAKLHALARLGITLRVALQQLEADAPGVNSDAVLSDLLRFEYLIESDHREWARLMLEAEWY